MNVKDMVRDYIDKVSDKNKAEFDKGLISSQYEIKGTKTRLLEDFAKSLIRVNTNFYDLPLDNHEEIVLAGFFIGGLKESPKEKIEKFKYLLPYIDNWGSCDMIVARLKSLESEKQFFIDLLKSDKPFEIRVGIVWLMKFQLKTSLKEVVGLVKAVKNDNFYVKMASAWCYAEAFVYDYEFMYNFVKDLDDKFIRNKTIQKACESFRVQDDKKAELRKLRIN